MKYYIGIDGGGTKTIFSILNENGYLLGTHKMGSASYKQIGEKELILLLKEGIQKVCGLVKVENADIVTICFGMPGFGESPVHDEEIVLNIKEELSEYQILVVNDCEVGWAGSLLLQPGINIVAGTGSIAFGKNAGGKSGRCGGWSEWFSDEGSGRWLGIQCMQIFSKEADGRLEKGALYELLRRHFDITYDEEVIDLFEKEYLCKRDQIAFLQKVLSQAAKSGDKNAIMAYESAAEELFLIVKGLKNRLFQGEDCLVSYSGGIFQNKELLLEPFAKKIKEEGMKLVKPQAEPYIGAALLAYRFANGKNPDDIFLKKALEK